MSEVFGKHFGGLYSMSAMSSSFSLAQCCIVESLRILSLFMHLHYSSSLSCHVCFVCASFHPHVILVCLTADWHLDCTRVNQFCLYSFDKEFNKFFFRKKKKKQKEKRKTKNFQCFSLSFFSFFFRASWKMCSGYLHLTW